MGHMGYMADTQRFLVRFWGARGSYPTPGPDTVRHGGNTSCIEVLVGSHILILDAGSGLIRLGEDLLRRTKGRPLHLSLLITHAHGDHLIGFPFFAPLFDGHTTIDFFGPSLAGVYIKYTQSHPLNGAILYRIEYAGRRLVYATDVEWREHYDPEFLAFAEGADLLIHDAQYSIEDYPQKQGFGHSTIEMATGVATATNVRELILFHHDPTYDDAKLDAMEAMAQTYFAHTRSACEGMEIDLLAPNTD